MSIGQASVRNIGTCAVMISEKAQATERQDRNSDAPHRGGVARSSDEAAVMAAEQRGYLVQLEVQKVNCESGRN